MRRLLGALVLVLLSCGMVAAQVNGNVNYNAGTSGKINEPPFGLIYGVRTVIASGTVTINPTDYVVIINKTVGAATSITLPTSPDTGRTLRIKDGKGDATVNNITITPASGNIDGSSTAIISVDYGSVDLIYNGTQWSIL